MTEYLPIDIRVCGGWAVVGVLGHVRHYPGPGAAAGPYAGVVRVLLTTIALSVSC